MPKKRLFKNGFTLVELMVVMVIIATLLTIAAPRFFKSVDNSKEVVLQQNLQAIRESLDKYMGDHGKYPATLNDLVEKKYLRKVPIDPITESSDTWVIVPPDDPNLGGVQDVKSGATGTTQNGVAYEEL